MVCMNNICPLNKNTKCTNEMMFCIARDLYNNQQQIRTYHLYTTKTK